MTIILTILLIVFVLLIIDKVLKFAGYAILFIIAFWCLYKLIKWIVCEATKNQIDSVTEENPSPITPEELEYIHQNYDISTNMPSDAPSTSSQIDKHRNTVLTLTSQKETAIKNIPKISKEPDISIQKNSSKTLKKQPLNKKKSSQSLQVSDAFLWQCNSIAELRDSEEIGYEYTNLDNPNDPLEVGYRNALLDISDYNTLPLIDHSKDKYAPGGYIPRKMISWEHDFEQCKNIFASSTLPIITNLYYITRNINTMILQDPDGSIGRSVTEVFFYEIPSKFQSDYLQLVNTLNLALVDQERFFIDLSGIVFSRTANAYVKYALPLSCVYYDSEKRLFSYCFSNEITFTENGSTQYQNTEKGSIIYTEDGTLKKATFEKIIDNVTYICRFKNYKSGFSLYDIKGNRQTIYKKPSK